MIRIIALAALTALSIAPATAAPAVTVPQDYVFQLHLTSTVSSKTNRPGDQIDFVMNEPVVVAGETIVERGAHGRLTVTVSGHAGSSGHEGDLTFRFEGVEATEGRHLVFDHQVIEINGRNNKVASAALGFLPIVGFGARFIRGRDVTVEADRLISTTLIHPALARPLGDIFPGPAPR